MLFNLLDIVNSHVWVHFLKSTLFWYFCTFLCANFLDCILGVEMSPKIIKNREKIVKFWLCFLASILTQFLLKFNSILAPFWLHLGSILGQKSKYFSNDAPRTDFYRFLPILDLIWGGFWTPDRLQDLKKYICWHIFAFTFAFGRLSTRTCTYF